MKIIKNVLIGLGVLLVLFIIFAIFMAGQSSDFKEKNEAFAKNYIQEFSTNWEIKSVGNKTTNTMLSQINTPNGKYALKQFQSFGKVVDMGEMELKNYNSHSSGITTGVFTVRVKFENADTLVTITIQEKDNVTKIHGFHINPISDISKQKEIKA